MPDTAPRIAVVGSINMDLMIRCATLPRPGETLFADSSTHSCGGKGANQAVAAARAGGQVTMIGRVGDDAYGVRLLENLRNEQVDCRWVRQTEKCESGLAVVGVERGGQNSILVVPGANAQMSVADVEAARSAIAACDVLLVQLEVPVEPVLAAMEIARANGVQIILDPAPAPQGCIEELLHVDFLCPNESEAAAILGTPVETIEQAESAACELHRRGARRVIVTLGERGALLWNEDRPHWVRPLSVKVVDTTAAGDAFAGALAVAVATNRDPLAAIRFANAAGALAASQAGAQSGMGTCEQITALEKSQR